MGPNMLTTRRQRAWKRSLAPLVLGFCVYLLWPAQAFAATVLRVIHALPGAGKATVSIISGSGTVQLGSVAFGQVTPWHSLRVGKFTWRLTAPSGHELASGAASIGTGAYTAVALYRPGGAALGIYRDRPGEPGTSLIRVIHAAPELGSPSLEFDSHLVAAHLGFAQATPYLRAAAGPHAVVAMAPGHTAPLLSLKVDLKSSLSYSAVVIGSRGQQVRVVTVTDRGAPLTRPTPPRSRPAAPVAAAAAQPTGGWVTVRPGDSLWRIARARVGSAATGSEVERELNRIWEANAHRIGTGDPNLIFPGQRLRLSG